MALICARGGSKGVPGKNIKLLGDKPLIAWSIESALACSYIDRLIVSTDSKEIAAAAEKYNAEIPFMRPSELATDNSPEWLSWQHALKEMEAVENYIPDYMIVLPPTSPFRSVEDIEKGIKKIHEGKGDIVISIAEAGRNPYFNMVEIDERGFANLCKYPETPISRRQDAPKVYDITTVMYIASRNYILKAGKTFDGNVMTVDIPLSRALDIDTINDFMFAEFLIERNMAV